MPEDRRHQKPHFRLLGKTRKTTSERMNTDCGEFKKYDTGLQQGQCSHSSD